MNLKLPHHHQPPQEHNEVDLISRTLKTIDNMYSDPD